MVWCGPSRREVVSRKNRTGYGPVSRFRRRAVEFPRLRGREDAVSGEFGSRVEIAISGAIAGKNANRLWAHEFENFVFAPESASRADFRAEGKVFGAKGALWGTKTRLFGENGNRLRARELKTTAFPARNGESRRFSRLASRRGAFYNVQVRILGKSEQVTGPRNQKFHRLSPKRRTVQTFAVFESKRSPLARKRANNIAKRTRTGYGPTNRKRLCFTRIGDSCGFADSSGFSR